MRTVLGRVLAVSVIAASAFAGTPAVSQAEPNQTIRSFEYAIASVLPKPGAVVESHIP